MDTWAYAEDTRGLGIHTGGFGMRRRRATHLERMQHGATLLGISLEAYLEHTEAGEKWCSGCKRWQPVAEFGRSRSAADGLHNPCRVANAARDRRRRDRERA